MLFNSRVLEEALVLNEGEIIALLNGLLQNWRIHLNSLIENEKKKEKISAPLRAQTGRVALCG